MTVTLLRGNAQALPLADRTVDLIVTSPPYFGLRSYSDGGEHYEGQVGDEATPQEFLDALLQTTQEMVRVLRPGGSIWVNLGDRYAGGGNGPTGKQGALADAAYHDRSPQPTSEQRRAAQGGVPAKSLIGIPWRYALRCVDELGLILRAEVIWSKPNGLPESATDRVRRSHETWFHFTREPRYYSSVDALREPHVYPADQRHLRGGRCNVNPDGTPSGGRTSSLNPLGRLPGSVWEIPTQPLIVPEVLGVTHFAAFPMELPRRIIRGWSPPAICLTCDMPHEAVVERPAGTFHPEGNDRMTAGRSKDAAQRSRRYREQVAAGARPRLLGYSCGCEPEGGGLPPPARPAVVLDPFGGTGTTALLASVLGRHGVSLDMSADYLRLARWRTTDRTQRAFAMQVARPELPHSDQLAFDDGISYG